MDTAIILAALAGFFWAANIVIVRWALHRVTTTPMAAATVGVGVAALVALAVALVSGGTAPTGDDLWRFGLVGAIAPGSSQGLFVAAIGSIGPSRTSVLIGTSPVFSVLLAIAFLDEGWQAAIVVGTLVTVTGGALISWEPHLLTRRVGVLLAITTAFSFGVRDVVARSFNTDTEISAWWSGALVLGAATVVLAAVVTIQERRRTLDRLKGALPEFLASGLMIGLALPTLLAALDRGRVGIVAPLSLAAQHVSVVVLAAIVFGAHERTPRILFAIGLV
ncbi:MAG: DMT family transporter, partial [Actinobacteria bacterium]|nr:DMT family transporter [Actinomycetota bacterium]NIS29069.1 DMT family transporter [Actinomycetota bacterium]NIT94319.1 DMT family transporter [Actinomycetota bacterium]NIU17931.1 DMT family transporter [Actinomycetota bacterium]NIU64475.1 DMT family transporter [Actinomycetota bacterium]